MRTSLLRAARFARTACAPGTADQLTPDGP